MKKFLLCALLMNFTAALPRAVADEWISEEYRCALTIPTQESWVAAMRQPLANGEVIFHAASMTVSQGVQITFVRDIPSSDIRNPVVQKRINELLEAQGWTIESTSQIVRGSRPYLQLIGQRRDMVAGKLIGVSRVTPRGRSLYVVTAYGKGEADRAEDSQFMRVIETFRFIEQSPVIVDQPEGPSPRSYNLAMLVAAGTATLLVCAFASALIRSRFVEKERA